MSVLTTIGQSVILFIEEEKALEIDASDKAKKIAAQYNITIEERMNNNDIRHCLVLYNGKPFHTEVSEVPSFQNIKDLNIDNSFYDKAIDLINEYKTMFNLDDNVEFTPDAQLRIFTF
jgi:hypothetical protein